MTSIPGWERKRLGDIATIVGGGTPRREIAEYWNGYIPWATPTDVTKNRSYELSQTTDYITEQALRNSAAKLIPAGSVLMTTRATIGYCVINTLPMATNQGFTNFICSEQILNKFLLHLLTFRREEFESLASGSTFKEISKSTLRSYAIDVPPLPEQRKIAAILTSVDDAIAATQRIIDQTERVKRGLMLQLLTRGIGHTKFKQTEIGEIPAEWEVVRLKDIGTWSGGGTPAKGTSEYWSQSKDGIIWVSPKDVTSDIIVDSEDRITVRGLKDKGLRLFPAGTILIVTRSGILRNRVPVAMAGETLTINQDLKALEVSPDLNAGYVFFTLKALEHKIRNTCVKSGTTVESIDVPNLKEFLIPLPPRYEQDRIAEIARYMHIRSSKETQYLNILKHLKRGLMQILLTGKVRVKVDEEAGAVV